MNAAFKVLEARHRTDPRPSDLERIWRPIIEALGAAESVHDWPAQKLLDYGNGILASLRPGMIYVGGTDPGCFIPTMLNEAGDAGSQHITLTQNALADASYLNYLGYLYGDRLSTLTEEDSSRAFQNYMADATRRFRHDQQFPNEPRQLRPGEEVTDSGDGHINVSGQIAVMSINERLLQTLLEKNPEIAIGYEESFPMKSTYTEATPLGPIMELRASEGDQPYSTEVVSQTLDYWRNTTRDVLADSESATSPEVLKTYSHTAVAQANLLAARDHAAEAEEAYRLASQLWPGNPESVSALSELLAQRGHNDEARQLLGDFAQQFPDQKSALESLGVWRLVSGSAEQPPRSGVRR
jgi:hypothetical protein